MLLSDYFWVLCCISSFLIPWTHSWLIFFMSWCFLLVSSSPLQSWNNLDLWWSREMWMRAEPVGSPREGRNPSCLFIKFRSWDFSRIHAFLRWVHILSCWRRLRICIAQIWVNFDPPGERINKIIPYFSLTLFHLRFSTFDTRPGTLWLATLFSLLNTTPLRVPPHPPLELQLTIYRI